MGAVPKESKAILLEGRVGSIMRRTSISRSVLTINEKGKVTR
jgi:hypothetical protein